MSQRKKIRFFAKTKNLNTLIVPFLFILTFVLIFFNKTDYVLVYKIKNFGIDVISPISRIVSSPAKVTVDTINYFNDLRNFERENYKLKQEIKRLKKWQTIAIQNSRENRAYKKLLNSTSDTFKVLKTTSVISQSPSIYSKTVIINAGSNYGIKDNHAVINERGLVGKIISVSKNNSKVLLINDQNSSVPVTVFGKEIFAIMKGSSDGNYLISSFVKDEKKFKKGDILLTSGNGNIFPKDTLVGKIIKIKDKEITAIPFTDLYNLEFLQVIDNNG